MPFAAAFALACAALVLAFCIAWLVQLRTRNAGMIDPLWAATLGGVAVFAAAVGPGAGLNRAAVALGGGAWGARLALHLWRRNHGQPEDPRYAALRAAWGSAAAPRMLGFYLVQALASMILSIAFFVPAWSAATPAIPLIVAALATGFAAVLGESAADRQLRRHIADPANRGRVCQSGWWRYSRHPNYFFESLHWCAYTLWSIGLPWGWATLVPPCAMAWLLLKVSGVPMLEARLVQSRAGYREYMRTTSAFIPWPPRASHAVDHHEPRHDHHNSERRPHP
jgi:steroid 5-alpha reductase family enzyme